MVITRSRLATIAAVSAKPFSSSVRLSGRWAYRRALIKIDAAGLGSVQRNFAGLVPITDARRSGVYLTRMLRGGRTSFHVMTPKMKQLVEEVA